VPLLLVCLFQDCEGMLAAAAAVRHQLQETPNRCHLGPWRKSFLTAAEWPGSRIR